MKELVFEVHDSVDAIARLADPWSALHARSAYRSLYNSHDFIVACVIRLKDTDARPYVLTARDVDGLVAIFPLQVARLEYHGAQLNVIEYMASWEIDKPYPVIARGAEEAAWSELVHFLKQEAGPWHRIDLWECRDDLPGVRLLCGGFRRPRYWPRLRPDRKSPLISLESAWDARWKAHKKMRKKVTRMQRAYGDALRFVVTGNADDWPALMQTYLDIESRGWKAGRVGIGRDPDITAFYRDLFGRLAARDALRFGVLYIGDRPVSIEIAYLEGDTVYFSHGTFDEEFATFSPGMVSTCLFLEHFHGTSHREGDFLAGFAGYMVPWCDRLMDSSQATVYRITPSVLYIFAIKVVERLFLRWRRMTGKAGENL